MPRVDLIQLRHGTAASWTSANPVLVLGEPGYETDTGKVKVGDGTTAWADLDYGGLDPAADETVTGMWAFSEPVGADSGVVIKSPDGTSYLLVVANDGTLSTEPVLP